MAEQITRKISFSAGGQEFLYDPISRQLITVELPHLKEAPKPLATDRDVLERLAQIDLEDAKKFAILHAVSARLDQAPEEDFKIGKDLVKAALAQRLSGYRWFASMSNETFRSEHAKNQATLRDLIRQAVGSDEYEAKLILDDIDKEIKRLEAQVK